MPLPRRLSGTSVESSERQVPWQFKWKRPKVAQAKSTKRTTTNEKLKDKIPIGTSSARLRQEEINTILEEFISGIPSYNNENEGDNSHNTPRMKWEDLESESDEEGNMNTNALAGREEYIVTVTLYASRAFVNLMQSRSNEEVLVPADSVLLEVVKDSHEVNSPDGADGTNENPETCCDEIEVVMTKLLTWPTSALIGTVDEEEVNNVAKATVEGGLDTERVEVKDLETQLLAKSTGEGTRMNAWKSVRKVLNLPKTVDEMDDQEKEVFYNKKLELRRKRARRRVGVTSATLFRRSTVPDSQVDMDDVMDVLNRMTLGTGLAIDRDLLATRIGKVSREGGDEEEQRLFLSCLCNDGRVHVFSMLDLLRPQKDKGKDLEQINLIDAMTKQGSSEDTFLNSFESLLLGDALKSSMDNTILPFTEPVGTVNLSVTSIKGKVSENDSKPHILTREKGSNPQLVKLQQLGDEVGKRYDKYGPHFDLSQFDANIEPSTMHDTTMNNIPFLSSIAYEYLVVAGKGVRKSRKKNDGGRGEIHHNSKGGFVTFISTRYFNETKTIFLPFVPKQISPIIWKTMKLLIVLGEGSRHCVAIRTDSSSYITSPSKPRRSIEASNTMAGSTTKNQIEFVKKFSPIRISFEDLDEDAVSSAFPVSVTCMPSHPTNILLCTNHEKNFYLENFYLDSLQFGYMDSNTSALSLTSDMRIAALRAPRKFLERSVPGDIDLMVGDLKGDQSSNRNFHCISGHGWSLFLHEMSNKMHIFFSSWDGCREDEGVYHEEIAALEISGTSNILNLKCLDLIEGRDEIVCQGTRQVAVASMRACFAKDTNLVMTMRSKAVLDGITSSYDEILSWLCDQKDYYTASVIALSLLEDAEALVDVENSMSSHFVTHDAINHDGILDSIAPIGLGKDNEGVTPTPTSNKYHEKLKEKVFTDLSNIVVHCFVNEGYTLAHALDKFLGRNYFYDATLACEVLVENATQTTRNLSADDMKHLAPYSYNPMQSEGHALWPIQCLLRVAVTRNCMALALNMLNENIPDELRHRSSRSHHLGTSNYASSFQLSRSIISMILASSSDAGAVLMSIVESGTEKRYWESLDGETKLLLSMLHVQGRYPLLREIEVRDWALKRLHAGTGMISDATDDIEKYLPSDWLRELCTGVLSNAGCNLSQTILFTPALPINPGESLNLSNKDMFQERQEEDEDLHDYLTAVPGFGGVDFDLIIPSFLILVKRNINWLGNDKISSQMILNVICDLAGRHSSEEPRFAFDSVSVMKQCVVMNNALAAANLIGGENGLVLECAHYISKEGNLSMSESERILRQDSVIASNVSNPGELNEEHSSFTPAESHNSILWLLEKYSLRVRKYGDFYSKRRGKIDPVCAARICFRAWLYLSKFYPGSCEWLEDWLIVRLNLNGDLTESKRLPHAAIIRALLWTETGPEVKGLELESKPVLAMSLGFSMPFLVNLARVPCGLIECVPTHGM